MRGPGKVATLITESGKRFVVTQRTVTRNRHSARKSVAKLKRVNETGNSFIEEVDSSLTDTDVAIDDAKGIVESLTDEEVTVSPERARSSFA